MFTTPANVSLLVLIGGGTGILGALLGTGGGVFLVPILVLGFGVPMHYALATSILSVIATSSAAAATNVERGSANMPLGMTLEIATALGGIGGGALAGYLPPVALQWLFALALLPTAWLMWQGRVEPASGEDGERGGEMQVDEEPSSGEPTRFPAAGALDGEYFDEEQGVRVHYHVERLWAGMLISVVAGAFSGLLGIGGGVFKVPALHMLCNVPMRAAAATSNFMIGVTAAASAFFYFGRGEVRPTLTATIVLGVLAGSAIGLHLGRWVRADWLRRIFAILLAIVAVQMAARALWGKG